ncbi:MAG: DUF262 domain-containing protein [Reinekea sp.]
MDETIEDLMNNLASSDSDDATRVKLRGKIESLKEEAESAIKKHQRQVSYDTKEFTVEMVVDKYHEGKDTDENELFVPDYQRDFVWLIENQSRLIESLMIGLPIPYIFIADVNSNDPDIDGRVEIVDGSQRIRTLHAFVKNELKLKGLKLVPEINGFRFCDLPSSRQRRFKRISIRIIELSDCTESTRRDLWERINTGSDELKDMEKRKGSQHGSSPLYKEVLEACADIKDFVNAAPLGVTKARRGEAMEFVLRFFAYLDGYESFDHSVRDFLDLYLDKKSKLEGASSQKMINEFAGVMRFVKNNFPHGFRKTEKSKTTPRVRFEAISVGVALALRENPDLIANDIGDWLFSEEFKTLTTGDGANSRVKVKKRIEYVRDKLLIRNNK